MTTIPSVVFNVAIKVAPLPTSHLLMIIRFAVWILEGCTYHNHSRRIWVRVLYCKPCMWLHCSLLTTKYQILIFHNIAAHITDDFRILPCYNFFRHYNDVHHHQPNRVHPQPSCWKQSWEYRSHHAPNYPMSWRSRSLIATYMPCCCTVSFSPKYATSNTQWAMCDSRKMSIVILPLTWCSTHPGPPTIETYFDDLESQTFRNFYSILMGTTMKCLEVSPATSAQI